MKVLYFQVSTAHPYEKNMSTLILYCVLFSESQRDQGLGQLDATLSL